MTKNNAHSIAIVPENLPVQLKIIGECREEADGYYYDFRVEDAETGRMVHNITSIEFSPLIGDDCQIPEVKLTLLRPNINMEVKAVSAMFLTAEQYRERQGR